MQLIEVSFGSFKTSMVNDTTQLSWKIHISGDARKVKPQGGSLGGRKVFEEVCVRSFVSGSLETKREMLIFL